MQLQQKHVTKKLNSGFGNMRNQTRYSTISVPDFGLHHGLHLACAESVPASRGVATGRGGL